MALHRKYHNIPPNASAGHKKLANILTDMLNSNGVAMTILYEYPLEKLGDESLADEYGVKGMSVDFYIQELNMAIEYQGAQHYSNNHFFGNGQPLRDERKRTYLKDIAVTLIEIPDDYKNLDKDTVCKHLGLL